MQVPAASTADDESHWCAWISTLNSIVLELVFSRRGVGSPHRSVQRERERENRLLLKSIEYIFVCDHFFNKGCWEYWNIPGGGGEGGWGNNSGGSSL